MKCNSFLFVLLLSLFPVIQSIYSITVTSIEGNNVSLSSFTNKKIIIATINGSNPNYNWLSYLDSLQNFDTSIQVIAVPSNDFGAPENDSSLFHIKHSLCPHVLMLKPAFVKKDAGINQNLLYKWLTDVNENNHFDLDVQSARQVFIVSRTGILYSVLQDDVSKESFKATLKEEIIE